MPHSSIIFSIIFAVLVIVLLWRIYVLWHVICTRVPSAPSPKGNTYSCRHPLSVFADKPSACILHGLVVVTMIIMTLHAITHAFGIQSDWWETTTVVSAWTAIVAGTGFIVRRFILKVKRFSTLSFAQRRDAYLILVLEIISAVTLLAYEYVSPVWYMWHYAAVLTFAIYITYSKHLHIVTAIPYMIFSKRRAAFDMRPVPQVSAAMDAAEGKDVSSHLMEGKMGVSLPHELPSVTMTGVFSCTQCGRCTEVCPPHMVGEDFSPMDVIYSIRCAAMAGTTIYPEALSKDKISVCISCGACVEVCPVGINPMEILWQIKRYACLEDGYMPESYHTAARSTQSGSFPLPKHF